MDSKVLSNRTQKGYKITQTIFYIMLIPLLFMAFVSSIVMFNTKTSGGYPNLLGYTVIQFKDNSFYDSVKNRYAENEVNLFFSLKETDYKIGDIIAYYSATSNNSPIFGYPSFPTNLGMMFNNSTSNTFSTEELSEISFGKIANIGVITEAGGYYNTYVCFSLYTSQYDTTDYDTVILAMDTIGKVVSPSPVIISFLIFCSSFTSFLTLVLLPCIILLSIQILAILFKVGIEREKRSGIKQKIIIEEVKKQDEFISAGYKLPKHPLEGKTSLAETVESFDKNKTKTKQKKAKKKFEKQNRTIPQKPTKSIPTRPIPIKPIPPKPIITESIKTAPVRPIPIKPIPQKPVKPIPQKPIQPKK
ncbi:MAG: hypothetical protein PHQ62_00150 [Clostridia bacterium]|nr:hypothetical protein [Clostridia bacterium]